MKSLPKGQNSAKSGHTGSNYYHHRAPSIVLSRCFFHRHFYASTWNNMKAWLMRKRSRYTYLVNCQSNAGIIFYVGDMVLWQLGKWHTSKMKLQQLGKRNIGQMLSQQLGNWKLAQMVLYQLGKWHLGNIVQSPCSKWKFGKGITVVWQLVKWHLGEMVLHTLDKWHFS